MMHCPACGHPEMDEKTLDETLSYSGYSKTLQGMKGKFCPKCGEGIWDPESSRRYDEAHMAVVTAARGDAGADIRRIRKSLKLTQAKLAADFGLGPLALSRYERGKTRPPVFLVKLLRLIEKHPSLLQELQEMDVSHRHEPTATGTAARRNRVAK